MWANSSNAASRHVASSAPIMVSTEGRIWMPSRGRNHSSRGKGIDQSMSASAFHWPFFPRS